MRASIEIGPTASRGHEYRIYIPAAPDRSFRKLLHLLAGVRPGSGDEQDRNRCCTRLEAISGGHGGAKAVFRRSSMRLFSLCKDG